MTSQARERGLSIKRRGDRFEITNGLKTIKLSVGNAVYIGTILRSFEYYFNAVSPLYEGGRMIVDYSGPRYHDVTGFADYPILFPSCAEPIITTEQYLEFAALSEGQTALDLGSYSGLTSIIFAKKVGHTGKIIAVEADPICIDCIKTNVRRFHQSYNSDIIKILQGAVWIDDKGLLFSSEGNMGSSAVLFVGPRRGTMIKVPTITLSQIADRYCLRRVDFIKCDIEGAEREIFNDNEFFNRYSPRIIAETHLADGASTANAVKKCLKRYGYSCKQIEQKGVTLPLLECTPPT